MSRFGMGLLQGLGRLWLCLLLSGGCGLAAASALQALRFSTLDSKALGTPSGAILTMHQDAAGLVWLGTTEGLARFDGVQSKVFMPRGDESDSLSHGVVNDLLDDGQGRLWVGTRGGLDRVDMQTEQVRRMPLPPDLDGRPPRVIALAAGVPGQIWVAGFGGLWRFDTRSERYTAWQAPAGGLLSDADEIVRCVRSDGRGGVWICKGTKVAHLDADGTVKTVFNTMDPRLPQAAVVNRQVRRIALDTKGRIWVALFRGGIQTWTLNGSEPAPDLAQMSRWTNEALDTSDLMVGSDGAVWVGMGGSEGLWRWTDEQGHWQRFRHHPTIRSSLASSSVTSMMIDRNNVLWVGSWGSGVSLADLRSSGFVSYRGGTDEPDSLRHDGVSASWYAGPDRLWVASYGGGLSQLNLRTGQARAIAPDLKAIARIKAIMQDRLGRLWIGSEQGVAYLEPGSERPVMLDLSLKSPAGASISSFLQDRQGDIWVSSADGVYRIDASLKVHAFRPQPSKRGHLSNGVVDSLLEDRSGRLWVGTKGGLYLRDAQGQFIPAVKPSPDVPVPARLGVHALRQDGSGRIWAATLRGLYELQAQGTDWVWKSWPIAVPPGVSASLELLQDDAQGQLWVGNGGGLWRFDPATGRAQHYPTGSAFDGGFFFGAAYRAPDNTLYFGGNGLLQVRSQALNAPTVQPRIVLSDVRLFNQSMRPDAAALTASGTRQASEGSSMPRPQDLGIDAPMHRVRQLRLSHRETMVSLDLTALHFSGRELMQLAWQLEGFDSGWIEGRDGRAVATYTNLNPDSYRLMARVLMPGGQWSEPQQVLMLEVLPPFWRTWWWYCLMLAGAAVLLTGTYRYRVRSLHATRLHLEEQVQARTQEVLAQQLQLANEKQEAEQQREAAEKARHNIALLSEIGRELTTSLDQEAVLNTLYRHVHQLVDAPVFGVGWVDWGRREVRFEFALQDGIRFIPYVRSLDAPEQLAVRCVLSGEALLKDEIAYDAAALDSVRRHQPEALPLSLVDGTPVRSSRSALYVPMSLGGKVVGVISTLSYAPEAYDQNDLNILSTLGAYAAVALDNAQAYQRLQQTQAQLVEQEKLAGLGALVAGVAHELNTPIGNSLLAASTLRDSAQKFQTKAKEGAMRRSDLDRFCEAADESTDLIVRSLGSAANLISSFKQLAVDQTSDQRRVFNLRTQCEEIVLTLGNRLRRDDHRLIVDMPADIEMDSFPGPFGQVLTNLIMNAMVHGLDGRKQGQMQLRAARQGDDAVRLEFSDNGCGISADNIGRIFDPFFTTRLGQGGSGLGLHISYNIVTSLLGGSIRVSSVPGEGTLFVLDLPRHAPS